MNTSTGSNSSSSQQLAVQQPPSIITVTGSAIIMGLSVFILLPILFVQCCAGRKPISSRGVLPFLLVMARVATAITIMLQFIAEPSITCMSNMFANTPILIASMALFFVQSFRFVGNKLLQLARTKYQQAMTKPGDTDSASDSTHTSNTVTSGDVELDAEDAKELGPEEKEMYAAAAEQDALKQKIHRVIRVLQFLSNDKVHAIVTLIAFCLYYAVMVPVFVFATHTDETVQARCASVVQISNYVYGVIFVALVLGMILMVAIDMIANIHHLCCFRWRRVFVQDDPMLYRLEYTMLFLSVSIFFTISIVLNTLQNAFKNPSLKILIDINTQLLYIILLIVSPGIPMFATMYSDAQQFLLHRNIITSNPKEKPTSKDEIDISVFHPCREVLEKLLHTSETKRLLLVFAMKEFSVENILFWEEVQKFKKLNKRKLKRLNRAVNLYDTFLGNGAILELNVTTKVKQQTWQQIENCKPLKQVPNDLFDCCEDAVMQNLLDTYSRFFKHTSLQKYLAKQQQKSVPATTLPSPPPPAIPVSK